MFESETTPKKNGFFLVSGVDMHKKKPNTFIIPDRKLREGLEVGQLVKLLFSPEDTSSGLSERMWVQVTSVGKNSYEGILRNTPVAGVRTLLHWGDLISFEPQHVLDIQNP